MNLPFSFLRRRAFLFKTDMILHVRSNGLGDTEALGLTGKRSALPKLGSGVCACLFAIAWCKTAFIRVKSPFQWCFSYELSLEKSFCLAERAKLVGLGLV